MGAFIYNLFDKDYVSQTVMGINKNIDGKLL